MRVALEEFQLRIKSDWVSTSHHCYRPPSWPPPDDWVVSEDRNGKVFSRWRDSVWDMSPLAGRALKFNFGDGFDAGRSVPLDPANARLLRIMTGWRLWGPMGPRSIKTVKATFDRIRRIFEVCSRAGILASDLMRFPKVLGQVPATLPPNAYDLTIAELHRYWDARSDLGFVMVDPEGIKRLAAVTPDHVREQTAYIPPRIWTYQVQRLRECLSDFLAHRQQVEDCFNFCVDSYSHNYGSLYAAMTSPPSETKRPFFDPTYVRLTGTRNGMRYHGSFCGIAERFGIDDLLESWIDINDGEVWLRHLSAYLTLIQYVGIAYITNFTLQRINEATTLRADCLLWEDDSKLGRVPIICGETTKTDPDSDARWPTSPSIEVAIAAMTIVARLRIRCASAHPDIAPTLTDQDNPYLFDRAFEPWTGIKVVPYTTRLSPQRYAWLISNFSLLFDKEQLRITEDDLRIARMLTPNLSAKKGFVVGEIWPLAWHQLRRTGAVNMFASGLLSDSSMQFQMKHSSRLMPLYYGSGYAKLHLNEEVEGVVIAAMYEAMARSILSAMGDRFVSPYSSEAKDAIIVNLIGDKDAKELAKAAQRGEVFFRETRLGGCTKRGNCSYGGIESVARCAGGDGYKPCTDVLYDRAKAPAVEKELQQLDQELARVPQGSPRHQALLVERRGLENFLNVVRN